LKNDIPHIIKLSSEQAQPPQQKVQQSLHKWTQWSQTEPNLLSQPAAGQSFHQTPQPMPTSSPEINYTHLAQWGDPVHELEEDTTLCIVYQNENGI